MEKDVQRQIIKYLEGKGYYVIKTIQTNKAGTPDILGCTTKGEFFAIEVKDFGKKKNVTKLQQLHIDTINKTGGLAFVADCIEDVKGLL
jgi:Holliday junction resolvase